MFFSSVTEKFSRPQPAERLDAPFVSAFLTPEEKLAKSTKFAEEKTATFSGSTLGLDLNRRRTLQTKALAELDAVSSVDPVQKALPVPSAVAAHAQLSAPLRPGESKRVASQPQAAPKQVTRDAAAALGSSSRPGSARRTDASAEAEADADADSGGEGDEIDNDVADGFVPPVASGAGGSGAPLAASGLGLGLEVKDNADDVPDVGMEGGPAVIPPEQLVRIAPLFLCKSSYSNKDAVVFFDYPKFLEKKREDSKKAPHPDENLTLRFKLSEDAIEYNCVINAFRRAGMVRTNAATQWNVRWGKHPSQDEYKVMKPFQKLNHFPGTWCIGRKDRLYRSIAKARRLNGATAFDFLPETYILPGDRSLLELKASGESGSAPSVAVAGVGAGAAAPGAPLTVMSMGLGPGITSVSESPGGTIWIMKPCNSSCGRGIKLVAKVADIPKQKDCIVSRYIANPLLIGGKKFDMRIYVLVTSYDPLRIYMYEEGLARFCTKPYSLNRKTLGKRFMHLTNYAVNKKSKDFVSNENPEHTGTGSKWGLRALRRYFLQEGMSQQTLDATFERIEDVLIKTIISIESYVCSEVSRLGLNRSSCFELLGFDVLLDDTLKPWLMEVNVSPSLSSSSPMDKHIKTQLLADSLHLAGVKPVDPKKSGKPSRSERARSAGRPQSAGRSGPGSGLGLSSPGGGGSGGADSEGPSRLQRTVQRLRSSQLERASMYPEDIKLLREIEDEHDRRGPFKRIFPTASNVTRLLSLFEAEKYNNVLLSKWVRMPRDRALALIARKPLSSATVVVGGSSSSSAAASKAAVAASVAAAVMEQKQASPAKPAAVVVAAESRGSLHASLGLSAASAAAGSSTRSIPTDSSVASAGRASQPSADRSRSRAEKPASSAAAGASTSAAAAASASPPPAPSAPGVPRRPSSSKGSRAAAHAAQAARSKQLSARKARDEWVKAQLALQEAHLQQVLRTVSEADAAAQAQAQAQAQTQAQGQAPIRHARSQPQLSSSYAGGPTSFAPAGGSGSGSSGAGPAVALASRPDAATVAIASARNRRVYQGSAAREMLAAAAASAAAASQQAQVPGYPGSSSGPVPVALTQVVDPDAPSASPATASRFLIRRATQSRRRSSSAVRTDSNGSRKLSQVDLSSSAGAALAAVAFGGMDAAYGGPQAHSLSSSPLPSARAPSTVMLAVPASSVIVPAGRRGRSFSSKGSSSGGSGGSHRAQPQQGQVQQYAQTLALGSGSASSLEASHQRSRDRARSYGPGSAGFVRSSGGGFSSLRRTSPYV